jgi:hypothetical protein
MDIVLPGQLVIELKAVEKLLAIHEAQLLTYLKLSGIHLGLLLNFNVPVLKNGIKRSILRNLFSVSSSVPSVPLWFVFVLTST